jgi:hypothetical protein
MYRTDAIQPSLCVVLQWSARAKGFLSVELSAEAGCLDASFHYEASIVKTRLELRRLDPKGHRQLMRFHDLFGGSKRPLRQSG